MFVQTLCCISVQRISNVLSSPSCWGFPMSFDIETVFSSSYVDACVSFYDRTKICNFHVLCIPIYGKHTGESMFNLIYVLLNSFVGHQWKLKLIGVSTDGATNMVGNVAVSVTRIQNVCEGPIYTVWCADHQLDLDVQAVFSIHVN